MEKYVQYYIASGSLTAMYTLCVGYGVDTKGEYIVNLSIDPKTAVEKAMDYVNKSGDTYPLDTSYADESLNDIIRRNQDQIEADNLRRKEENLANWIVNSQEVLFSDKNPFDKIYSGGRVVDHAPLDHMSQESINYWAGLTKYKSVIHEAMSNICKPKAIYIPKNANKHFGSVGDKVTVKAFVLSLDHYKNDFGYNNYSVKMKYITENGERLVTNGGSGTKFNQAMWDSVHTWVELEATIKAHNEFTPTVGYEEICEKTGEYIYKEKDGDKTWNTTSLIRPKLIESVTQDEEVA
jgi:hypothetical protein